MDVVTLDGTLDALDPIREYVKEAAAAAGLDDSATYNLTLAVDEIATNVIVHGYQEAGLSGDMSIGATVLDDRLIVQLRDHGKSYDPNFHPEPDDEGLSK